jgi:aspartate 1-decarboxylase
MIRGGQGVRGVQGGAADIVQPGDKAIIFWLEKLGSFVPRLALNSINLRNSCENSRLDNVVG